jgi:hypothetical protein
MALVSRCASQFSLMETAATAIITFLIFWVAEQKYLRECPIKILLERVRRILDEGTRGLDESGTSVLMFEA